VIIKTYPNQKLWIDGSIRTKLKARTTAFNRDKVTGNMAKHKQCSYSRRKAIKQAKRQYRESEDAIQWLRIETYVPGSTDNHGQQRQNQPHHGHRCLVSGQAKHLLPPL
jgi:hypothetical protein